MCKSCCQSTYIDQRRRELGLGRAERRAGTWAKQTGAGRRGSGPPARRDCLNALQASSGCRLRADADHGKQNMEAVESPSEAEVVRTVKGAVGAELARQSNDGELTTSRRPPAPFFYARPPTSRTSPACGAVRAGRRPPSTPKPWSVGDWRASRREEGMRAGVGCDVLKRAGRQQPGSHRVDTGYLWRKRLPARGSQLQRQSPQSWRLTRAAYRTSLRSLYSSTTFPPYSAISSSINAPANPSPPRASSFGVSCALTSGFASSCARSP